MILLFEEHHYKAETVLGIFKDDDDFRRYGVQKNGKAVFNCVGYFYSQAKSDAVFILPKVLLEGRTDKKSAGDGTEEGPKETGEKDVKAFGHYPPEAFIDFDGAGAQSEEEARIKEFIRKEKGFISRLAVWLYQAIQQYTARLPLNRSVDLAAINDVQSTRNPADVKERTYLDIILQLFRFHREHSRLFTYITLSQTGGHDRINWRRTLSRKLPLLTDGVPFYHEFVTRSKTINYDETLITLFYGVLMYLREKFHFRVVMTLNYRLPRPAQIETMIAHRKGTRLLRSIRRNYFKDELVALWKLLYVFFNSAEAIASGRYHAERLIVRSFNNVFEDMIDKLLSDGAEKIPPRLKEQRDGKLVDHIYRDASLTGPEPIYYIGDSKYYKDGNDVGDHSVYKQFTYAKNVVQFNVGILKKDEKEPEGRLPYRDELTEGYNVTPNFFIRGEVKDFAALSEREPELSQPADAEEATHTLKQFKDRLFDRDTLLVQTYNINFLYVLNAYISRGGHEAFRRETRKRFREDLLTRLNGTYDFFQVDCADADQQEAFVNRHFREWLGKMYRVSNDSLQILLAFEKKEGTRHEEIIAQVEGEHGGMPCCRRVELPLA